MEADGQPTLASEPSAVLRAPEAAEASWHPAQRVDYDASESAERTALKHVDAGVDESIDFLPDPSNPTAAAQPTASDEDPVTNATEVLVYENNHNLSAVDASGEAFISQTVVAEKAQAEGTTHSESTLAVASNDDEAAIFRPDQSVTEQARELEHHLPSQSQVSRAANAQEAGETAQVGAGEVAKAADEPNLGYSHQGEATDMDEAIDEAPSAPLMMDPEDAPTAEEMNVQPQGSLEMPMADAGPSEPHIDRSFTTNFTEVPAIVEQSDHVLEVPRQTIDDAWPTVGDDKTFGELLGDREPRLTISHDAHPERPQTANDDWGSFGNDDAFGELLANQPTGTNGNISLVAHEQEDMTAMWQAALDDDDLLPDVNDMDPSSFFGDDDEGFLDDDFLSEDVASQLPPPETQKRSTYVPANASQSSTPAIPNGIPLSSHGRSAATPETGLQDLFGRSVPPQQPMQRPDPRSAASFADKAKGGYQSPYDLPTDVIKPPRQQRPRPAPPAPAQPVPSPPSRSGSYSTQPAQMPPPGPPQMHNGAQTAAPPTPANGLSNSATTKAAPGADSGFFADLPVAPKTRPRQTSPYAPSPQPSPTPPPVQFSQQQTAPASMAPPVQPPQRPVAPATPTQLPSAMYGGLTRPEQLPLLPDQPMQPEQHQAPMGPPQSQRYSPSAPAAANQAQNRYSPAPVTQAAPSAPRYSPAPVTQPQTRRFPSGSNAPPGIQNAHPFAPRTSSPLAFSHEKPQQQQQRKPSQPYLDEGFRAVPFTPTSPQKTNGARPSVSESPERPVMRNYTPTEHPSPSLESAASPQRRSTDSPPAVLKTPKYSLQSTPSTTVSPAKPVMLSHRRQFSRDLPFAAPADERAQDPLERWKGHPIFHWRPAGSIAHSFPRQTPFYAQGQTLPSIKCTPGVLITQEAPSFLPIDDRSASFPGPLPLRAKGKKKDVLAWMTRKIEDQQSRAETARTDFQMSSELRKRTEEKLVLWRLVKIFVEHDGSLEPSKKTEDEIRAILLPDLAQMGQVMELESPASAGGITHGDPVDRSAIIQLRQALLEGQRERAVWLAEEKKLWGHAMLIASTLGPDTWKQVIQSFVRSQVKTVGSDARALAALYQVFAGNSEECVDELVPPSARAGFKMVSKIDGSSSGDPLEGLDQWRETLGLVAGNRTPNDAQSLLALGQMLSGYGRAEAAHSCFLFARQLVKHSGADDADAHFVLLGANHKLSDEVCGSDLDSILLTEIYEWASSLSATSTTAQYIPHLQSFKLIHAQQLAAYGLKAEAQSYCDHITSAYQSTTRPSQYYHPTFTQSVNDLSAFLSQTPHSGPQSLLSKKAMNKVSSGAANWFSKFVAGDDDQSSNGSGPGAGSPEMMSGPFGRVNGDSPTLSRTGSSTELYNPMVGGAGSPFVSAAAAPGTTSPFQPSSAPSRYAPAGKYAPLTANSLGITTSDASRPSSSRSYAPVTATQALDIPRPSFGHSSSGYNISRPGSAMDASSQGSYEPKPLLADEPPTAYGGYQPYSMDQPAASVSEATDPFAQPPTDPTLSTSSEGGYNGYQPPTTGYEPPLSGYEPPSYQPYEPDIESTEDSAAVAKPKKKSFMDDDDDGDDFAKRAAALKKAQADRAADEAFRKAAEADAARDKEKSKANRSSWFGGLFKKDGNAQQPGPIRAKLGEENSFYYDENLKKWVNKKGGPEAAAPVAATPPPPKGPVSRIASGASGPPSGPPSRVSSMGGMSAISAPPGRPSTAGSQPPGGSPALGPSSGPPSRAGTPGAGFDAGPPQPAAVAALNGEAAASAPPSRPATSMSNASSLDDLLGGPPGPGRRAGGAAKNKKKGGRYVDVMANS